MKFTKLVPNLFYSDINVGLQLFVECLEFSIGYDDLKAEHPFCVVNKDDLSAHLHESREYAEKDRPEIRLQTNNIEEAYAKISQSHSSLLHPNLKKIKRQPWGAKEFALLDESGVCVIIQEWPH